MYLVDTSIWVDYFIGSETGRKFHQIIQNEEIMTTESVISEIKSWCLKEKLDFSMYEKIISSNAKILSITYKDWVKAAEIKHEQRKKNKKFGIMDAIIVSKQEKMMLLTKDTDFKGLARVKILE